MNNGPIDQGSHDAREHNGLDLGIDITVDGMSLKMAQQKQMERKQHQSNFDIRQDGDDLGIDIRVDGIPLTMA